MNVTMYDQFGRLQLCETPGCGKPATSVWSVGVIAGGASAGDHRTCGLHNPWNKSRDACPHCGKQL